MSAYIARRILLMLPTLLGNLFEQNGNTLVLAAHTRASAPAHCGRDASLPYTGSHTGLVTGVVLG